jgi:glycosyltransferase involved in cell wall biosynthesis
VAHASANGVMKALFLSNLFPDATNPNRGIYNAQLLKYLSKHCEIRALSPRPAKGFPPFWLPNSFDCCEQDKTFAPVYPPAAYVPKIGSRFNHLLMARTIEPALKKIREKFPFEVVLSSWIYPDGCATAELARRNNFPFVVIAQGSDVHQYLKIPARREIIASSLSRASAVVSRSEELARQLNEAGIEKSKMHVIYNGVDFKNFFPTNRIEVRNKLGFSQDGVVLLYVGNFLPIKNPLLLVEAHAEIVRNHPGKKFVLVMVGTGSLINEVQQRTNALGTSQLVSLVGSKSSREVAQYMQASDLLCVPSDNEGVPNVILEAFACGLRVVARKVGGIPEVLSHDFLGTLVEESDPRAMAQAIAVTVANAEKTEDIIQHARRFSWEKTAQRYFDLLKTALQADA